MFDEEFLTIIDFRHLELLLFLKIRRYNYLQRLRLIKTPFYDFCVVKGISLFALFRDFSAQFFVYFINRERCVFLFTNNVLIQF